MRLLLVLVFLILAVWFISRPPAAPAAPEENLSAVYVRAVDDAKVAEEDEIYSNLSPIAESNARLVWDDGPEGKRVLVVTWTSWDGYLNKTRLNTSQQVWVTAAPQIRDFIKANNLSAGGCALRLEQLLGLPPNNGKKWFVELWVKPEDLFRPTPDPETGDSEAQLDFPPNASPKHRQWFNQLKNTSYGPNGYPWTRLGYTYDWGNPQNEVGLSEYVINKNAETKIRETQTTKEYCRINQ